MSLKVVPGTDAWPSDEQKRRRRLRRWSVTLKAVVWIGQDAKTCSIQDISPGGAGIETDEAVEAPVGTAVQLALRDYPPIPSEIRHRNGNVMGLVFLHDGDGEVELGNYLTNSHPARAEPRKQVRIDAELTPRPTRLSCVITNLSKMGASISIAGVDNLSVGDEVQLSIAGYGDVEATVRRIADGEVGLMFKKALIGELPS